MQNNERLEHFKNAIKNTPFEKLHVKTKVFIKEKVLFFYFSHSQIKNIINMAIDLQMWQEDIEDFWEEKESKKETISCLENRYQVFKNIPKKYNHSYKQKDSNKRNFTFSKVEKLSFGFGSCPVASPKTRCCNLMTLDVFEGCGFGCSYCSIQSFYDEQEIKIDKDFSQKLSSLKLNKERVYHIGTGQSSDSLMFGNSFNTLEVLLSFAKDNENVILELKSKSKNIDFLLKNRVPSNVICTFSLNPQNVIDNEEHFTATLEDRINSAKKLTQKGILVGFHFHPMIIFDGWQDEYDKIAQKLISEFNPNMVAMISFGTLTFIKPVIKKIRTNILHSKILQMPLVDAGGKFSYPLSVKEDMFKTIYDAFSAWHDKVFFYLCMEDESLWKKVFGYEYKDNDEFENAMKKAYMQKIITCKNKH